jgi:hypothetical protein
MQLFFYIGDGSAGFFSLQGGMELYNRSEVSQIFLVDLFILYSPWGLVEDFGACHYPSFVED